MDPQVQIPATDDVETLLVLHQHRAKPFGSRIAKQFIPGEKYQQSGLDKLQVLGTGHCTRNLSASVPQNVKRVAPKKGEEKYANPVDALSLKIDKLADAIADLVKSKK